MRAPILIATLAVFYPVRAATAQVPAHMSHRQDGCGGLVAGALAFSGLVVYDIATAPASARWYNSNRLAMSPIINPREHAYGVAFSVPLGSTPPRVASTFSSNRQAAGAKSEGRALLWSLGATIGPMIPGLLFAQSNQNHGAAAALIIGGLLFGPSAGHWYAERWGRGFASVGARLGVSAVGIALASDCSFG
ncbi:MAG: hypothetical protein IH877_09130 [Gemmatimonadetes bacterium]|nr:hypothetical protein [Gemmatimonadota bacterium]